MRLETRVVRLRRTLLAVAAAAATIVVLAAMAILATAAPAASSTPTARQHALCGSGYVAASLPWGHKCLRSGQFCKVGNRAYLRYGFYCPSSGHLRRQ
jgi:hypothetical protein